jgi:hypothetical protein
LIRQELFLLISEANEAAADDAAADAVAPDDSLEKPPSVAAGVK